MAICVIDIGSNTIKSLVAVADQGAVRVLAEGLRYTRISAGIGEAQPRLSEAAVQAGVEAVRGLILEAADQRPERYVLVATAAVRAATNGEGFLDAVEGATGYRPRVLSGDEEARLIARGVEQDPAVRARHRDFLLFDLGGGSLELIHYRHGDVRQRTSLPLGAVRLTERFGADESGVLSAEEVEGMAEHVAHAIGRAGLLMAPPVVGTGGGVGAARLVLAKRAGKTPEAYGAELRTSDLAGLLRWLAPLTHGERQRATGLPPSRADILPAGLVVYLAVLNAARAEQVIHSVYNLRYGLAAETLFG